MRLFISYRRDDSSGYVNHLYDLLCEHFSADDIFRDVRAIQPGEDFVEVIENAVAECEVLLAVIGKQWVTITDSSGNRRLDDPYDFVRIEIATALARNIRVIPLLVGRATMPSANHLPDDLRRLARRNALELSDKHFKQDVNELVSVLKRVLDSAVGQMVIGTQGIVVVPQNLALRSEVEAPVRVSSALDILPPPFAWCQIPDKIGKQWRNQPYAIAKYPITNAQFQTFINDSDGYNNLQWWDYSAEALAWRQEHQFEGASSAGDDHPRTHVCWLEAIAFCQWLSAKTNLGISLPTEQQWQYAAQGDDGRAHPWGNTFDKRFCNTSESGIGETTPVTQYEGKGDSPFGVVDMEGNVGELCVTKFETGGSDFDGISARVLLGASFFNRRNNARTLYRTLSYPNLRSGLIGFRIACERSADF